MDYIKVINRIIEVMVITITYQIHWGQLLRLYHEITLRFVIPPPVLYPIVGSNVSLLNKYDKYSFVIDTLVSIFGTISKSTTIDPLYIFLTLPMMWRS